MSQPYRHVVPAYRAQLQPSIGSSPYFATPAPHSLKRPFRHRRKDPSCDACRERKVKCDASGTNSCTECRTRNIKCQFTREHMRRLTSMKQVQDLERKLRNAKMEVSNLQSQMQRQRLAALDDPDWSETSWRRNSSDSDVREALRSYDFSRVRDEIVRRSPGLFTVPPAWREAVPDPVSDTNVGVSIYKNNFNPTLPPRAFAEHLLELYKTEAFAISPYVEFQTFVQRVNDLYDTEEERNEHGIPMNASRGWLVLFFATLALTSSLIQDDVILEHYSTQQDPSVPIGWDLADSAAFLFGPVTKKNNLDDVRGALTLAVYYKQLNELGAANIWLGLACKIAQHLGFHRYSPGFSKEEEEGRANTWWDIYLFDRILAGQQGCEMTIQDGDCDLRPPDLIEPAAGELGGRVALQSKLYSWTMLHGKVVRLLRDSPFLSEEEIDKLDSQIQSRYDKMPTLISYNADESVNSGWYMDSHIFVNYTKFRVFRHNLTPNAQFPSRLASLRRCIEMAKDASPQIAEKFKDIETVSPQDAEAAHEHNQKVVRIMYPEHCQYLYSCAMFLVVAKMWSLALPFVIALRVIGTRLAINKCCCRYLWGVIKFTEGRDSIYPVVPREAGLEAFWTEEDEEVLALISADMNQDARAWEAVWQKEEERRKRPAVVSVGSGESELHDELASISGSDLRSTAGGRTPSKMSEEEQPKTEEEEQSRPVLGKSWSVEEETWDSMVSFIREKCAEMPTPMEDIKVEGPSEPEPEGPRDPEPEVHQNIQRRMSISNFL